MGEMFISRPHIWTTSRPSRRLTQIGELVGVGADARRTSYYCGRLQRGARLEREREDEGTYYDSWAEAEADGTDISYNGNAAGNTRSSRIDYIYFSRGATALKLKSSQVFDVRDSRGVMPSDHRPLLSVFSIK